MRRHRRIIIKAFYLKCTLFTLLSIHSYCILTTTVLLRTGRLQIIQEDDRGDDENPSTISSSNSSSWLSSRSDYYHYNYRRRSSKKTMLMMVVPDIDDELNRRDNHIDSTSVHDAEKTDNNIAMIEIDRDDDEEQEEKAPTQRIMLKEDDEKSDKAPFLSNNSSTIIHDTISSNGTRILLTAQGMKVNDKNDLL